MAKKAHFIFGSVMTIVICTSTVAGATLALFATDDTKNINVTSGKIDLSATVDTMAISSCGIPQTDGEFANGGSAYWSNEKTLDVYAISPGDSVDFTLKLDNQSTIDIKYRTVIRSFDSLETIESPTEEQTLQQQAQDNFFKMLEVSINGLIYSTEHGLTEVASAWTSVEKNFNQLDDVAVTVRFPEEAAANEDSQGAACKIVCSLEAVQGNYYGEDDFSWYYCNPLSATEYRLTSAESLNGLDKLVESGITFKDKTVFLANDISLGYAPFDPIGGDDFNDVRFQGIFDGNGYTVSELYIQKQANPSEGSYYCGVGFFSNTLNATVRNVIFKNARVNAVTKSTQGAEGVGTVIGNAQGKNTKIENVQIIDSSVIGNRRVGGLVGSIMDNSLGYDVTVTRCSLQNVNVTAIPDTVSTTDGSYDNGDKIGGLIGQATGFVPAVTYCTLTDVTVRGYRDIGGLCGASYVGDNDDKINHNTINGLTAIADQTSYPYGAKATNVSAFIGRILNGKSFIQGETNTATNVNIDTSLALS